MTRDKGDGRGPPGESGDWPRLVRVRAEEMGTVLNIGLLLRVSGGLTIPLEGGFIRFSFWRLWEEEEQQSVNLTVHTFRKLIILLTHVCGHEPLKVEMKSS